MYNTRKITEFITWIGGSDRRLSLFENLFPIPNGVSYNSYLIRDEKIAIMDTVDSSIVGQFMENLEYVLDGKEPDYLVVNHMEPDHCAAIGEVRRRYPLVQLVGNQKTLQFLEQFFPAFVSEKIKIIAENDTLSLGKHTLHFMMAPMVHWPEAMVTFEESEGILFSADAFGTFGALEGNLFNDELNFEKDLLDDARRYYTNIVGKYGVQVQMLLKKASALSIKMICPLHGPIWRTDLAMILQKYDLWSRYEPEEKGVLVAYASMYGNTENAANVLAVKLAESGVHKITVKDVSVTDISYLISDAFKYSHIVLAAPTYNGGTYSKMETFINDMKALNLQNRTFALIENGTWAPTAGRQMAALLESTKNNVVMETTVTIKSTMNQENEKELEKLAVQIQNSLETLF